MSYLNKKILFIALSVFSLGAFANNYSNAPTEKVSVKCYVELYGGTTTIASRAINLKDLRKLKQQLVNTKIRVPGVKQIQQIYKVNECVPASRKFKSKLANTLYDELPR